MSTGIISSTQQMQPDASADVAATGPMVCPLEAESEDELVTHCKHYSRAFQRPPAGRWRSRICHVDTALTAAAQERALTRGVTMPTEVGFAFGLVADIQYACKPESHTEGRCQRYGEVPAKLSDAVNNWQYHEPPLNFILSLGDLVDGRPIQVGRH